MSRAPKIKIPPEAKRFVECARRYCALVGEHEKTPIRELLAALHVLLPELYARGVALPTSSRRTTSSGAIEAQPPKLDEGA
ncbi:MAG: DUF5063 domain-containing protein [Deltaproteobacteria bacterium]|nr:DUF5063 domain-containing protein [Deltaproteobacteria bacterium]